MMPYEPSSWLGLAGLAIIAVPTLAAALIAARRSGANGSAVEAVRDQVQNDHTNNLRDDIDEIRQAVIDIRGDLRVVRADVRELRGELRDERSDRASADAEVDAAVSKIRQQLDRKHSSE